MTPAEAIDYLKIFASDAWRAWLAAMLDDNPNGLGSELVLALPGPDNSTRADSLLAAARAAQWLERTFLAPSESQLFLGLGGKFGADVIKSKTTTDHHGQLWAWRIIDREAVETHVGKRQAPAAFELGELVKYKRAFVEQVRGGADMRKRVGRVVGFIADMRDQKGRAFPRVLWRDQTEAHAVAPSAICAV